MSRRVASRRLLAVFLWIVGLLAVTATATESVAPRRLRQEQETTAADSGVATVAPAQAASSETASTTDEDTHTWELVDTVPMSAGSASESGSIHQAHLDFQEKVESGKSSTATTAPASSASSTSSSSSSAAATHHSTPMVGYVIVGAMAIVCVGIAAGVAKRKRDAAGSH